MEDISPSSPNSFINYHKLVDTFYTDSKFDANELFSNNTHLKDIYYESFFTIIKIIRQVAKSAMITPDLEEFVAFVPIAPKRDEIGVMFAKLIKSLYRPRVGKFSSKFARLLYKLKTVDMSKKDRIKYIKGLIDVIRDVGMKYKTFDEAMDYFSSTYKI